MNYKKSQGISINKTLIAQIIFVAVIAGGILFIDRFFKLEFPSVDKNSGKSAALLLDFEDMKRMFEGEVTEKMTILDALNVSVAAGQVKLQYVVDADNNTAVVEINDHIVSGGKNFTFYVNERKIDTKDLNRTFVNPGDKIIVKLE